MSGLVQYEDLLSLLTCLQCRCLVSPPVAQCRKGHLYCLSCKSVQKLFLFQISSLQNRKTQQLSSCKICKQTFVDAPNQALEKMVGLIGLPCKYGERGCTDLIFLPSRLQHETLCRFSNIKLQQRKMNKFPGFGRLSANSSATAVTRFIPIR